MDPTILLGLVPEKYAMYVSAIIIACKLVTVFVRPPQETSKWAPIFKVVSTIGLNVGWAANRLQVGRTGVMTKRENAEAVKAAIPAIVAAANDGLPEPASVTIAPGKEVVIQAHDAIPERTIPDVNSVD